LNKKRMEEGKGSGLESGMEIWKLETDAATKFLNIKELGITNKSDRRKSSPSEDFF
jgi:hypothetical protein